MHILRPLILTLLFLSSQALAAENLQWAPVTAKGDLVQGGLVRGTVPTGWTIALDGAALPVSDKGNFVFGFHRDHEGAARLVMTAPDGARQIHDLAIQKRDFKIQRIDGLPPKKVNPPKSVLDHIASGRAKVKQARASSSDQAWFATDFIWPSTGRISGVYGSQRILNGQPKWPHFGIDIAAPTGTDVLAPADGIIMLVEADMYYEGGLIIMDHGHQLNSAFLHLSSFSVKPGQKVKKGDKIGEIGATGRATGPHLDWRINWRNERIDPQLLVPPMPK